MRLSGQRYPVREPARPSAHGLGDEVALRRHGVRAQVSELPRDHVDRGEEPEGEIDAVIVVVDRLGEVHDFHALGARGQALLVFEENVRGLQRAVAADRDEAVDAELEQALIDDAQALHLRGVVEIRHPFDFPARAPPRGTDDDAPLVAKAPEIAVLEEMVVLALFQRSRRRLLQEARVTVKKPDHLHAPAAERGNRCPR